MFEIPPTSRRSTRERLYAGIACNTFGIAKKICSVAFENGLIIETSGPNDEVIKLLPSLTIDLEGLSKGLEMLEDSISTILKEVTH